MQSRGGHGRSVKGKDRVQYCGPRYGVVKCRQDGCGPGKAEQGKNGWNRVG